LSLLSHPQTAGTVPAVFFVIEFDFILHAPRGFFESSAIKIRLFANECALLPSRSSAAVRLVAERSAKPIDL
jgi:hypothetical protein